MSDLISRSKLKKTLLKYNYTTEHNQIFRYIDEQPTAYDIDKVISELNEKAENHGGEDYYIEIGDAIEIVKQGIVSEDVCEWEKGFSGYVGCPAYYSKCCTTNSKGLEMQTHIIADWKFCPYCGKKIKIVGD